MAVFSDADASAVHTRFADEAINIGPAPSTQSYLDMHKILAAMKATGADAVHPGYGFLSENAAFAQAVEDSGAAFVGPPHHAVHAMGDKVGWDGRACCCGARGVSKLFRMSTCMPSTWPPSLSVTTGD